MAIKLYETETYTAHLVRGDGVVLSNKKTHVEVFFQPGDDANGFMNEIGALDEMSETNLQMANQLFDRLAWDYFPL